MRRRRLSKKRSKRTFRRGTKTHRRNLHSGGMRGGYRL